jgi:hypothetical protein
MGQIWFQHQPIEIQVVPVDFFVSPSSDDCSSKYLRRPLVHFFSNSKVSRKFTESMFRVPFSHKSQSTDSMLDFLAFARRNTQDFKHVAGGFPGDAGV